MKLDARRAIGAAALVVLLLGAARASGGNLGVFDLRGVPSGDTLQLTLKPGPAATKAIRVYSEPSHTFLWMVVDPDLKKTRSGKAWLQKIAKDGPPAATATTELPGGQPSVEVPAPPAADDRVDVWVFGRWENEREEDRVFHSGKLDPSGYLLSVEIMVSK